jgi:hypothetical protein
MTAFTDEKTVCTREKEKFASDNYVPIMKRGRKKKGEKTRGGSEAFFFSHNVAKQYKAFGEYKKPSAQNNVEKKLK